MSRLLVVAEAEFAGADDSLCSWDCPHQVPDVVEGVLRPRCELFREFLHVLPDPNVERGVLVRLQSCLDASVRHTTVSMAAELLNRELEVKT